MAKTDCPWHEDVKCDIERIDGVQRGRDKLCAENNTRIKHLEEADGKKERTNADQWTAINSLRRMVYIGLGGTMVLAFLGSILGAWMTK